MSEWIEWKGGECPVEQGVVVDVMFVGGGEDYDSAGNYIWHPLGTKWDIAAYRVRGQKSGALDTQIGGDHYKQFKVQPVEFINANNLDFLQGSVIKYISRHKLKGKQADVEKAIHFCKLIIELQYESASS